ncbi:extracellular solute-binding protein [Streptomyces sp. NPDC101455]|uniref:ABC transporter substrate-binding protein n=1 Tax=Streptomyces sp. NPDC101455 TaxID=3366142 RepID=UPI00381B0B18
MLQQASSRTLPDVLMLDNPDLQQVAASGALAPLSDFGLKADGYAKGVVDASTYQGKLYGLRPVTNTLGLFYNKGMLDKAGVKPPTTWAELKSAAKKLTSGKRYGIAFAAPVTYEGTWQFLPFMWSNDGDEKDIATPQVAQALQLWVDLVEDGSASKSVVSWAQADADDQFAAGNAAMMINGPWQFPILDKKSLHYGVVQVPVPKAGGTPVVPLGGETWTVPQTGNAQRQARAAKVVACLNSDKNQLSLAQQRQTVPTKTALNGSWCSPGAETSWNGTWRASGEKGSAQWDGDTEPVLVTDVQPAERPRFPYSDIAGALRVFVESLRTGSTPMGEVHENTMSLAMVEAAVESARTGQRVLVDDVLDRAYAAALRDERHPNVYAALASWPSVRGALAPHQAPPAAASA